MKRRRVSRSKRRGHIVTALLARDGFACGICHEVMDRRVRLPDSEAITLDHIVPVSAGGLDKLTNLRLAHNGCNGMRGDTPINGEVCE